MSNDTENQQPIRLSLEPIQKAHALITQVMSEIGGLPPVGPLPTVFSHLLSAEAILDKILHQNQSNIVVPGRSN